MFLRPFAIPDADRLVYINETAEMEPGVNYTDFDHWRFDRVPGSEFRVAGFRFRVPGEE